MRPCTRCFAVLLIGVTLVGQRGYSAERKTPDKRVVIQVQPLDSDFDASKLAEPGVKVHAPPNDSASLPSPGERDQLFSQAGLTVQIAEMDEADRDMLFERARDLSNRRLHHLYPGIQAKKLDALAALVRARKVAKGSDD